MKALYNRGMSWPIVKNFLKFYVASEMTMSSIAVAYYLLLAIFPLTMVLANVLPFLNLDLTRILTYINRHVSKEMYEVLSVVVRSVLSKPNLGLLSVSALLGLWTFSKALIAFERAVNKTYGVQRHRGMILSNLFSLFMGLAILVMIYLAALLSSFGQSILTELYLNLDFDSHIYLALRQWTLPTVIFFIFGAVYLLYLISPNVKVRKLRYILPGAGFSTFILVFFTNLLGHYITQMLKTLLDIKVLSSLVIFALMVWFVFIARILIIGSVLNASYQYVREGQFELRRGLAKDWFKKESSHSDPNQG